MLTVERFARMTKSSGGNSVWLCRCECGETCERTVYQLTKFDAPNCGCWNKELRRRQLRKHGHYRHKLYPVWRAIINRCTNPNNHAYERYGGRGIGVDSRWLDFDRFVADVEPTCPGPGYSIDRKDNDKSYGPDNFRWADSVTQNNNRRDNVRHNFRGRQMTAPEIAREAGINCGSLRARMRRQKETAEEAVAHLIKLGNHESASQG